VSIFNHLHKGTCTFGHMTNKTL